MNSEKNNSEKDSEEPLLLEVNKSSSVVKIDENSVVHQPFKDIKPTEIIRNKSALLLDRRRNEKTMEKWKLVPPDGGWGWLVLFGATLVNILAPGTIKSFGVLLVEFMEAFEATPTEGMWIPALCYFLYSSLGPISSILSVKYSYRTVTILGGISAASGMILSFWATSVPYLYFTYGVLVGTGAGLSFPPTVYIVTSYFVKLRGIANGICISGSAFGSILLPPLLRLLLETYGYKGACLIMGGITLNIFLAALFYDPVEKHLKKIPISVAEQPPRTPETTKLFVNSEEENMMHYSLPPNDSFIIVQNECGNDGFLRSASSAAVQNVVKSPNRERKISVPTGKQEVMKYRQTERGTVGTGSKFNLNSNSALHAVPEILTNDEINSMTTSQGLIVPNNTNTSKKNTIKGPKRSTSTSSFQYISTPYHGSTLNLQPEIFASSFSLKSIRKKAAASSSNADDQAEPEAKKIKLFDITLLKDPIYLIILISNMTNAISYTNFIILLPSYAKNLQFDKNSGAMLISIVSALDLVGRIGGSALSDLTTFPKWYYFFGGLLISGISLALMPFSSNYWTIAGFCSVFGLASGTYVGITAIVMADLLGEERLQSTYGISLFLNGLVQLIGPPICGVWFEATQSFVSLFFSLGIILTAGSALWSFVPFILNSNKYNNNNNNNKNKSDDENTEAHFSDVKNKS